MVKRGAFQDCDIAITWHPGSIATVVTGSSLAAARVDFEFFGKASHAAASPDLGRSALDAVELMNVGVNYMREHMSDRARIHYAYIDAGGISPNVVQAYANARYVVREPSVKETVKLIDRVVNVAKGAALMTETEMKWRLVTISAEVIANTPCVRPWKKPTHAGRPDFTDVDVAYAKRFQNTLEQKDITASYSMLGLGVQRDKVLADFLPPLGHQSNDLPASTDVGDVSWVVPTVQLWGANYAIGTPYHTWQMVAQGKSAPALKGMVHAATVMAMTGVDAITNPELREAAWADLKERVGEEGYVSALPDDANPDQGNGGIKRITVFSPRSGPDEGGAHMGGHARGDRIRAEFICEPHAFPKCASARVRRQYRDEHFAAVSFDGRGFHAFKKDGSISRSAQVRRKDE